MKVWADHQRLSGRVEHSEVPAVQGGLLFEVAPGAGEKRRADTWEFSVTAARSALSLSTISSKQVAAITKLGLEYVEKHMYGT